MLDLLRRHSRSWLIWAIFIVLILVFIFFFGPQTEGFAPGSRTWAVRVPGDTIYDTQINATLQRVADRTGRRARLDDAEYYAEVERVALDLALVHILARRGEEAGIGVGPDEVTCYIVNWNRNYVREGEPICEQFGEEMERLFPNFDFPFYSDAEGRFSRTFRQDVRARFAMSIEEYEAHKIRELIALKYLDIQRRAIRVPPTALQQAWERRNTTVDIEYIELEVDADALPVSDAAVERALAEREAELRSIYESDTDRFTNEREIRLERVFLRKPSGDEVGADAVRTRAEEILARAQAGDTDFAEIVREETDLDRERESGGDMGVRTESSLDSTIYTATLDLEVGEFAIVEQSSAINVIRLAEETPAQTSAFEDVAEEIARELLVSERADAARAQLNQRAERIIAIANEQGLSLEMAAAAEAVEHGGDEDEDAAEVPALSSSRTGAFARERAAQRFDDLGPEFAGFSLPAPPADEIPNVGRSADAARIAFALTEDSPVHPEIVTVDGTGYIFRLAERIEASGDPDAAEWAELESDLRSALEDEIIGFDETRLRLLLHADGAALGPFARSVLRDAISSRTIRLRERIFDQDPALEL